MAVGAQGCPRLHFQRGCRLSSSQAEGLPSTGPMSAKQLIEPKGKPELPNERKRAVWIKTRTAASSDLRKSQLGGTGGGGEGGWCGAQILGDLDVAAAPASLSRAPAAIEARPAKRRDPGEGLPGS